MKFLIYSIFLILTSAVFGQVQFHALEDVLHFADSNAISLLSAHAAVETGNYTKKQATGQLLPTISVNGGYTDNIKIQPTLVPLSLFNSSIPAGTYTEATFGKRYIYNAAVYAEVDLLNPQNWLSVKIASIGADLATAQLSLTRKETYQQLAAIYYSVILLTEAEKLALENVQTSQTTDSLTENRYREGLINEVQRNKSRIQLAKAEKNLITARENKKIQLLNLQTMLNCSDSISIIPQQSQPTTSVSNETAFSTDPQLTVFSLKMQLAEATWKRTHAAFSPTLSAVYQYNQQVVGDEFLRFNSTNNLPSQYWGLRLSIPVFTGNYRYFEMKNAKINYDLSIRQLENEQLQSRNEQITSRLKYDASTVNLQQATAILSLFKENNVLAEQQLNEGIISLDERLNVYTDLINYQNEYLQNLSDFFLDEFNLYLLTISL